MILVQIVQLVIHKNWGLEVPVQGEVDNAMLVPVAPLVVADCELVYGFTPL